MSLAAAKAIKAVLHNKDIAELLNEDQEIFGVYGEAYKFIVDYYGSHHSAPTKTLLEDKFGEDLFDEVPDIDGATRHYLNELRDDYLRSNIEQILITVSKNMQVKSPAEIIDRLAAKMSELSRYSQRIEDIDIMDVDEALKSFQKARDDAENGTGGIMTGIPVWDEFCPGGMLPGQNIVAIGYSGRGKSWIADLLAANVYAQGKKVLLVSLEMSAEQQRHRIWSIIGNGEYTMNQLQRGDVTEHEVKRFGNDRLNTGGKLLVAAVDGVTDATPNVVRAKIERHKPDLVIIDYLQLMMDNSRTREMTPRMLNLSREIKLMAVACQVPIITISAVTDDEGKKRNSPPTIAQIAWSKGIEYDADLVIAVHKYEGTEIVEIACRKNRNGQMFNLQYEVDLSRGIFEPFMEPEDEEDS